MTSAAGRPQRSISILRALAENRLNVQLVAAPICWALDAMQPAHRYADVAVVPPVRNRGDRAVCDGHPVIVVMDGESNWVEGAAARRDLPHPGNDVLSGPCSPELA